MSKLHELLKEPDENEKITKIRVKFGDLTEIDRRLKRDESIEEYLKNNMKWSVDFRALYSRYYKGEES